MSKQSGFEDIQVGDEVEIVRRGVVLANEPVGYDGDRSLVLSDPGGSEGKTEVYMTSFYPTEVSILRRKVADVPTVDGSVLKCGESEYRILVDGDWTNPNGGTVCPTRDVARHVENGEWTVEYDAGKGTA